ncbi:DoxX family protein [Novosphingobium flavum]|uniref:DoxX family protein n=1 Tax=Novosphingobium flavum TaxID=1778672 RepID=A0A7X1KMX7_9SPHN|nr:DoxX family protein [Novosphingobium flavum]MBC2667109.1 DoxX family protein [Novosphingobium flavum]
MTGRMIVRGLLGLLYLAAGVLHLILPRPFIAITPGWVPDPALVIALTGLAEIAGSLALLQPWSGPLRRAAGWGLAAYALCVWPANMHHMALDLARSDHGLGLAYHLPRMAAQPVLIWAALWTSGAIGWPFARKGRC